MNGFHGGGGAAAAAVERDYVGISAAVRPEDEEREDLRGGEEDDEELELGLSLGAKKAVGGRAAAWGEYCRILTAKDFPSLASRASPRSSTSSVSSSSATLGGGAVGTKRTADSVASDAVGSTSPPSPVVVGWPPIRAFRINTLISQSRDNYSESDPAAALKKSHPINVGKDHDAKGANLCFVKVNMDGDPIGRKVDLNAHHSYETLALALEAMFHKPTMTAIHGVKASKLLDGSSEFALTYEDKDGDWMLVGDVPWGMFLDTVKRLRIMRTSEARGLAAPRFQPSKSAGPMRNKPA